MWKDEWKRLLARWICTVSLAFCTFGDHHHIIGWLTLAATAYDSASTIREKLHISHDTDGECYTWIALSVIFTIICLRFLL